MLNIQSAANAYDAARAAIAPQAAPSAGDSASQAAAEFTALMGRVDQDATGAMTGQVETHQLVQTIAEAELALQTVVAIRDKVVEAYQEILRMPV